ncbi:glutamate--tRNA ligase [Micromonospora sp. CPCC 206060]|uniref:glutamate--tRNA ligase n=1 Tax=Micromonospora sp. CPCC 206060 TaxID=3122406 RepID=UPI002FF2EDE5
MLSEQTPAGGQQVRVRIAPSPTGDPHVGTAYVALFNLAFARRCGGRFILRIEDTDQTRYVDGSEQQIFDTLRWLGLHWDEGPDVGGPHGPYRQSERLPRYAEVVDTLIAQGLAYRCWCSSERLAEMRTRQQQNKQPTGYDRLCLGKTRDERAALPGFSEPPVVRMRVPEEVPAFQDLVRGEVRTPHPDDQVLLKADGFPTYHLAVVVDDHDMGITHVVRGEEWISSTSKHILLYTWLDWPLPQFAHLPLLRNADRSKISKRKNPAARLKWFQEEGYLPQALLNFLGLMGYSQPDLEEIFDFDAMCASFDFSRVNTVGPVFDIDKLNWLNGHYLRSLPVEEFLAVAEPFLPAGVGTQDLRWIVTALQERTKRLSELPEQLSWLHDGPVEVDAESLTRKGLPAAEAAKVLSRLADDLAQVTPFEPAPVEAVLNGVCEAEGANRRRMFMTTRTALVGGPVSPPLHETIAALGAARTAARLRAAAELLLG